MMGPKQKNLKRWIEQNMSELAEELSPLSMLSARLRLNEITGLKIAGTDSREEASAKYLEKLKEKKEASRLKRRNGIDDGA